MKNTIKRLILYAVITAMLLTVIIPVSASTNEKCKITVNGQEVNWKLEPFIAYAPLGDVLILIPVENLFTTLGYKVTYDAKLKRSIFSADKKSDYISFYIDINTGQAVKEGEKIKQGAANSVYIVNDNLYAVCNSLGLKMITKAFMNDSTVKIDYDYIYTPKEDYITDYINRFPMQSNLSSLKIEIAEKYPNHPFAGEQYTKYNTGEWVGLGAEVKNNFDEVMLRSLWDGFDNLRFYTGKGEQNELTGKGRWNSTAYAIAWELMDAMADEINRLRKQDGLPELKIDNSLCFISVGAADSKVDSVFDNAIHNFEHNKAAHTYSGKSKMAECLASVRLKGEEIVFKQKYDNSTAVVARNTVNAWYKSPNHKKIMMNEKYKTMGILVVITNTGTGDAYAVFK